MKSLLEQGADPNQDIMKNVSLISFAAKLWNSKVFNILIKQKGIDLNT